MRSLFYERRLGTSYEFGRIAAVRLHVGRREQQRWMTVPRILDDVCATSAAGVLNLTHGRWTTAVAGVLNCDARWMRAVVLTHVERLQQVASIPTHVGQDPWKTHYTNIVQRPWEVCLLPTHIGRCLYNVCRRSP